MSEKIETDRLFWYRINVITKRGGDRVESLYWELLPWEVRMKWDWYFKYRAALLQVKYPRFIIDQFSGNTEKVDAEAIRKKNDIIRLKGDITRYTNKRNAIEQQILMMRETWNQLFPIEDDPEYFNLTDWFSSIDCRIIGLKKQLKIKQQEV